MAKCKVGLVGCRRGAGIIKSLATHPLAEIAAVCDIDDARKKAMAISSGPDLVLRSLPWPCSHLNGCSRHPGDRFIVG